MWAFDKELLEKCKPKICDINKNSDVNFIKISKLLFCQIKHKFDKVHIHLKKM